MQAHHFRPVQGARRLVDGVTDSTLSRGVLYASAANKLTRSLGQPSGHLPRSGHPSFQDHANEAIHRFIS
jgi:hypothetical protein